MNTTLTMQPTKKMAETIVAGVMVYILALGTVLYSSGFGGASIRVENAVTGRQSLATADGGESKNTQDDDGWSTQLFQFVTKMAIANQH